MYVQLRDQNDRVVCERCTIAADPISRMKGLLGRRALPPGEGLLLRPGGSIHMFFMRFPIDAVFLDGEQRVVKVVAQLAPWRMAAARGARSVLEIGAGEAARLGLEPGVLLHEAPA
jgi:uncharacterized membrane protein (UPF0127 family)